MVLPEPLEMTTIDLTHEVMVDIPDRESPHGTSWWLRPDIEAWLDERLGDDWDYNVYVEKIRFSIPNQDIAILFKLTWGGK